MIGRLVCVLSCVAALAGCGGESELRDLAVETCAVLADPSTSLAESSSILFESTSAALDLGYTESEFADALRTESVIIGGDS